MSLHAPSTLGAPPEHRWQRGEPAPRVWALTCGTAPGSDPGGPAAYPPADLEEAASRNVTGCLHVGKEHGSGDNPSARPRGDGSLPEMATLLPGSECSGLSIPLQDGITSPPQTTPGQEKAVSWRAGSCHHNSRSWGMWVLQPVPAQSRVSSVPVAEGRSAGQAPGTAQSPSACTSLYPCPGDSLHPPKKGWEGDGGANGPAGAGW